MKRVKRVNVKVKQYATFTKISQLIFGIHRMPNYYCCCCYYYYYYYCVYLGLVGSTGTFPREQIVPKNLRSLRVAYNLRSSKQCCFLRKLYPTHYI